MSVVKISVPTKAQAVHGLERALAVFLVASYGYLQLAHFAFSKSIVHGAVIAGATAVYQLVLSTVTTL